MISSAELSMNQQLHQFETANFESSSFEVSSSSFHSRDRCEQCSSASKLNTHVISEHQEVREELGANRQRTVLETIDEGFQTKFPIPLECISLYSLVPP